MTEWEIVTEACVDDMRQDRPRIGPLGLRRSADLQQLALGLMEDHVCLRPPASRRLFSPSRWMIPYSSRLDNGVHLTARFQDCFGVVGP
jgi:hypothetical protein